jgi:hypothetical protein
MRSAPTPPGSSPFAAPPARPGAPAPPATPANPQDTGGGAPDREALARWLAAEREEEQAAGAIAGGGSAAAARGGATPATSPARGPSNAAARGASVTASESAEAALRDLLITLPSPGPASGFARRVMARAELAPWLAAGPARAAASPAGRPWAGPWQRAALLLAIAASGCALLWVPAVVHAFDGFWSPAELLEKSIACLMSFHLWLASTLGVGEKVVLLCKALAAPLATAPFVLGAAVCLLISAAAYRVLRALIHSDRRWVYVDPI